MVSTHFICENDRSGDLPPVILHRARGVHAFGEERKSARAGAKGTLEGFFVVVKLL